MPNYVEVECAFCGKIFKKDVAHYNWALKNNKNNFYCSKECQINARKKRIVKKCLYCGKSFEVPQYRFENALFCSFECKSKYRSLKQENICEYCGKPFKIKQSRIRHSRGHYCSKECYYKHFKLSNKIIKYPDRIEVIVESEKYGIHTILLDPEYIDILQKGTIGIISHHTENVYYARIYIKNEKKSYALHRYITNCPKGLVVDHINHNTLDNRKCNLKVCSSGENTQNKLHKDERDKVIAEYKEKYYL